MLVAVSPKHRPMLEFLYASGFSADLLRLSYPIPVEGPLRTLDVVAFGRSAPQDMTTAAIAGEYVAASKGQVPWVLDAARSLAAPLSLIAADDGLDLWKVGATPDADALLGRGDQPRELAGRFAGISNPESLLSAKQGRQLTLFPVEASLLARARRGSSDLLSELVQEAMLLAIGDRRTLSAGEWQEVTRLVVQALAALVVRDKFELQASGLKVLDAASARFPDFFKPSHLLDQRVAAGLADALGVLERGVNYRGVDSAVVSRVYENTVVSTAARTKQGIYYTPPELADRIAATVPFEEVAPNERIVLDPACGSGTLLLAAHDRLVELLPSGAQPDQQQSYVRGHLIGYDSDPFAAEIAKLSLLLHSLPFGNGWRVETRDALDSTHVENPRPSFVISNPPWRGRRSVEGQRTEDAIPFLHRMLQLASPRGFVAAVLPASWLQSRVARQSREWLAQSAELFEIWRLPEGTFETAQLAPCVVFARAGRPRSRGWVFRRIRPESLARFEATGRAGEQWMSAGSVSALSPTLLRGPFDALQPELAALPTLGDFADVESCPVPEPGRRFGERGDYWLLSKAGGLPAYGSPNAAELVQVDYPGDFHRAARERGPLLRREKVLVSSRRSPANPWRLKAGLDRVGVIPRESLHMVVPRPFGDADLYALLALLGSRFASAWIDIYEPKRTIDVKSLRSMPVPRPGPGWGVLADAGRRLHAAAATHELSDLARAVDGLIEALYGLPDRVRQDLDGAFGGKRAPEGTVRYPVRVGSLRDWEERLVPPFSEPSPADIFGAVLAVQPPDVRLWVPGNTPESGLVTRLPPSFPGWLCVEGSTFDVQVGPTLAESTYRYQPRAYMGFSEAGAAETPQVDQ